MYVDTFSNCAETVVDRGVNQVPWELRKKKRYETWVAKVGMIRKEGTFGTL